MWDPKIFNKCHVQTQIFKKPTEGIAPLFFLSKMSLDYVILHNPWITFFIIMRYHIIL